MRTDFLAKGQKELAHFYSPPKSMVEILIWKYLSPSGIGEFGKVSVFLLVLRLNGSFCIKRNLCEAKVSSVRIDMWLMITINLCELGFQLNMSNYKTSGKQ